MYGFIWRHLPGPAWLRAIEALILIAGVVYVLMQYVFPWANATWHLSGNADVGWRPSGLTGRDRLRVVATRCRVEDASSQRSAVDPQIADAQRLEQQSEGSGSDRCGVSWRTAKAMGGQESCPPRVEGPPRRGSVGSGQ